MMAENTTETTAATSSENQAQASSKETVPETESAPEVAEAPKADAAAAPGQELSFAEMFELAEKQATDKRKKQKVEVGGNIRVGQVIFARVVGFSADSVFLDVGAKSEGVIKKAELLDEAGELNVKEGDKVEARVRNIEGGTVMLSKVLPHQSLKNREELREAHRIAMPVEGKVTSQNKGGYDVEIGGMRAFCPASQIDMRPGPQELYVGKKFPFRITEFKDGGRNIVVSRRALLAEENKKKGEEVLKTLEPGQTVTGTVTSVKDYGAFVDIGGLEGLVHLSEISHSHLVKPQDGLKIGDEVTAQVLKIEEGKEGGNTKISLSIKALSADPWSSAQQTIKEGMKVTGKVARIQNFGAFVEIMPGVDGLIHISNMALGQRVKTPRDVVKEGEEIEATVISVDWDKRRIGLSLVKTRQELADELKVGTVLDGQVDKIESFGLFVKLPSGARGLVPAAETGTQRGADLKKEFHPGSTIKIVVQEVDHKSGKIRLSIKAAKDAEERAEYVGYISNSGSKGKGLGTLGDLLKARGLDRK